MPSNFQIRPFDPDGFAVHSLIEARDTQAAADTRADEIRRDHPGTISRVEVRDYTPRRLEIVPFDDSRR